MILVIDTVRHPGEHMQLNESIVRSLLECGEEVVFHTSLSYWESFPVDLRERMVLESTAHLPSGIFGTLKTIYFLLKKVVLRRDFDTIFFLSSITYNSFLVALFSYMGLIKPKVFIFLHEVSYLDAKNASAKLAAFFLKLAIRIGLKSNGKFMITGEYIKWELEKRVRFNKESTVFIEHPTTTKSYTSSTNFMKPIRLAAIGVQCDEKNSYKIEEVAEFNYDLIREGQIEISTIGRLEYEHNTKVLVNHVGLQYNDYFIQSREFQRLKLEQHYLMLFFGKEYDLKTSGVFFEAINYQKPILAIRCNLVNFYFDKFGNIGHLYNDINEMKEGVRRISIQLDLDLYNQQVHNLGVVKKVLGQKYFYREIQQLLGAKE